MADPTQSPAQPPKNDPGYVQRLINALTNWNNPIKANPNAPGDPTGVGGAARDRSIDKQVAEAGG